MKNRTEMRMMKTILMKMSQHHNRIPLTLSY
jgi:hypothetical protein